jgi:histidinol dehydrogenase
VLTRLQAPPYDALATHLPKIGAADPETAATVRAILDDVRLRGDAAVREHAARLDGVDLPAAQWEVPGAACQEALARTPVPLRAALDLAVTRVRAYHEKQRERGFLERDTDGTTLGMRVTPLDRVGVYVPGGKAAYPSTVIMNTVPAVVAGVPEIVMVTPPAGTPDVVLAAARLAGVSRLFRVGGAQAIAALAYGTATLPRVDKIVGPGNRFVTEAKRQVAGEGVVGIDRLAGPTEVLVIADDTADPRAVAADLIAQAEHDEDACAWCVTTSVRLADALPVELARQAARSPRRAIVERSLADHGVVVVVPDLDVAVEVANRRAAEHVEVLVGGDAWAVADRIRHAGAIFVGGTTPEPVGDYVAGPSHVLPTAGTARYVSPLGVYDFVKRTSMIAYSPERLARDAPHIIALAEAEGLHGHAEAVRIRRTPDAG